MTTVGVILRRDVMKNKTFNLFVEIVLVALLGLSFFWRSTSSASTTGGVDVVRGVYDKIPETVQGPVFELMESMSNLAVGKTANEDMVACLISTFDLELKNALKFEAESKVADQLEILRCRLVGDEEGVAQIKLQAEQLRRDRAEDLKGGPAPTEKEILQSLGLWSSEQKTIAKIVKLNKEAAAKVRRTGGPTAIALGGSKPQPSKGD